MSPEVEPSLERGSQEVLTAPIDALEARRLVVFNLSSIGLVPDKCVVVGGAALAARGIRVFRDIDVIVPTTTYSWLLQSPIRASWEKELIDDYGNVPGIRFNPVNPEAVFLHQVEVLPPEGTRYYQKSWKGFERKSETLMVSEYRYLKLKEILKWKRAIAKDPSNQPLQIEQAAADIKLIEQHLKGSK